jgi:hypothetical protein
MRFTLSGVIDMRSTIYSLVIAVLVFGGQPASASIKPGEGVPCDFVTGGGWIQGQGTPLEENEPSFLPVGAKANFGVGGGVKNGAFWGHLEYTDHSTSPPMQVHGTSVTAYFADPSDPDHKRTINGTARINGVDGFTYEVEVADFQEPGRGVDEFTISLSNGYEAGTNYGDGPIQGGNIQLHKANGSNATPPPGFTCSP